MSSNTFSSGQHHLHRLFHMKPTSTSVSERLAALVDLHQLLLPLPSVLSFLSVLRRPVRLLRFGFSSVSESVGASFLLQSNLRFVCCLFRFTGRKRETETDFMFLLTKNCFMSSEALKVKVFDPSGFRISDELQTADWYQKFYL